MPLRDVLGHSRLISLLARSVAGGTLPPSLLFTGPSGVGKRKTALALAQALNCLSLADIAAARVASGGTESDARALAANAGGSLGDALEASAADSADARTIAQRVLDGAAAERSPARRIDVAKELLAKTGGGGAT